MHDFDHFQLGNHDMYLDQAVLNKIHETMVKSVLLSKSQIQVKLMNHSKEAYDLFQILNLGVHTLEKKWSVMFRNESLQPPNFVPPLVNTLGNITTFDVTNINLVGAQLGRSTFEKWENFDENADDIDSTNFEHLYGTFELNLFRPRTIAPPPEYLAYCTTHKVLPHGNRISLGNIKNLSEKLGKYREILYNNIVLSNNAVRLELQ